MIELDVSQFRTRAQVHPVAQDAVADVSKMPGLGPIQENRVLNLRRMPHHAMITHQCNPSYVGTLPELGIGPDIGGTFDNDTRFNYRTGANKDLITQ